MTDLNLAGLRENLDRLERNEAWPVDPPHLIAVLDRLEAAERERDRLREALGQAIALLDAVREGAGAPLGPLLDASMAVLGIRAALAAEEGTT